MRRGALGKAPNQASSLNQGASGASSETLPCETKAMQAAAQKVLPVDPDISRVVGRIGVRRCTSAHPDARATHAPLAVTTDALAPGAPSLTRSPVNLSIAAARSKGAAARDRAGAVANSAAVPTRLARRVSAGERRELVILIGATTSSLSLAPRGVGGKTLLQSSTIRPNSPGGAA